MINVNECRRIIKDRIEADKKYLGYPMIEERCWIPMSNELSKDINETIEFWRTLNSEEFLYTLEVLDEIIKRTKSCKILEAVKQFGMEKKCDMNDINNRIEDAQIWLLD